MDDKRNIIMAVLLTGIILFGWPVLMETFFPDMVNKNEVERRKNGRVTVQARMKKPAARCAPHREELPHRKDAHPYQRFARWPMHVRRTRSGAANFQWPRAS